MSNRFSGLLEVLGLVLACRKKARCGGNSESSVKVFLLIFSIITCVVSPDVCLSVLISLVGVTG